HTFVKHRFAKVWTYLLSCSPASKISSMQKIIRNSFFSILILCMASCGSNGSWRTASKESANIAPLAQEVKEDIFQIYVARAWSWRGYFAVHPWVAWKKAGEEQYTTAS